jgi:hypothetical protein
MDGIYQEGALDLTWRQVLSDAFGHSGLNRDFVEEILLFLLMFTALLLPIRSVFARTKSTDGNRLGAGRGVGIK